MAASDGVKRPAGKRKFNEEKWRQILDAAATTFAAQGYEATSIRDVAEEVGMLGGSLYYYIKTKEDLLYALIDDFHRMGSEEVERAEREAAEAGLEDDPLAMLRAVCARHAEVNTRSRTLATVFYNDFRHLSDERKQHIVESRRRHQRRIQELVQACQASGEIDPELDARMTALAMLSMLNAMNTWYRPDRHKSGQPIGDFVAGLLIDGVAVRPAPARKRKPAAKATGGTRSKTESGARVVPLETKRATRKRS